MKKRKRYILLFTVWAIMIFALYKMGLINGDFQKIKNIIENDAETTVLAFIFISFVRIAVFLPNTIFMILGGICFGPLIGFMLSMVSFILSETVIYMVGKYFAGEKLKGYIDRRHRNIVVLLNKHGYEFLALGVMCPISPTDLVCFAAAMLGCEYKKYMLTSAAANTPMMLLYSFVGENFGNSMFYNILMILLILLIGNYTALMWKRLKNESANYEISSNTEEPLD